MECPLTLKKPKQTHLLSCLNPCSNGMPSDVQRGHLQTCTYVLILVLMECPLTLSHESKKSQNHVLILVLMECPLTFIASHTTLLLECLNPCSNGMPSDTMIQRALTFLLF